MAGGRASSPAVALEPLLPPEPTVWCGPAPRRAPRAPAGRPVHGPPAALPPRATHPAAARRCAAAPPPNRPCIPCSFTLWSELLAAMLLALPIGMIAIVDQHLTTLPFKHTGAAASGVGMVGGGGGGRRRGACQRGRGGAGGGGPSWRKEGAQRGVETGADPRPPLPPPARPQARSWALHS
jgi:hypothetical protein